MTDNIVESLLASFARSLSTDGIFLYGSQPALPSLIDLPFEDNASSHIFLQADFGLSEFEEALQAAGSGAEFMWPGTSTLECGRRLLATNVLEEFASKSLKYPLRARMMLVDKEVKIDYGLIL